MFKFSLCPGSKYELFEQIDVCRKSGINNLELTENKKYAFYELDETALKKHVLGNKMSICMLNLQNSIEEMEIGYLKDLIKKCSILGIDYLNIQDFMEFDKKCDFLIEAITFSKIYNIQLCVENKLCFFMNDCSNLDMFFKNPGFSDVCLVFNPMEFVKSRKHPFLNVFYNGRFKNSIRFLRICDGIFSDGSPRLPGEGNAEIKELISALVSRSYRGYLSLFPYMESNSIEWYEEIFRALTDIICNI